MPNKIGKMSEKSDWCLAVKINSFLTKNKKRYKTVVKATNSNVKTVMIHTPPL